MEDLLIPGLPDEVARDCLARAPRTALPAARYVCKLWRSELDSPDFGRLRRALGVVRTLVAVAQIERTVAATDGTAASKSLSFRLVFYEPHTRTWSSPPPIPGVRLPLFCQIAGAGRQLVVIGGWHPSTWAATDGVYIYNFDSDSWRRGAPMPGPRRSFFACAASPDGRTVYVAGGHDEEKNALKSALAYDVAADVWMRLPDMSYERDECGGVFRRGAFHVVGGYSTLVQGLFTASSEAYDPATGRWMPVIEHTLGSSGESPRSVVAGGDGRLYRCTEGYVEVLESEEKNPAWRIVAEIPRASDGKPTVAPFLVSWPGTRIRLTLIGSPYRGVDQQAGHTLEIGSGGEVRWDEEVAPPSEFAGNAQAACCLEI